MKRRRQPEQEIQRTVFAHLRQRGTPGAFAFHVPNGGARTAVEAAIFQALGVMPGVPDLIILKDGKTFGLELKAHNGRLSDRQIGTIEAMRAAGAIVGVARGIDEALRWLEGHHLLRGKAS
jgi:hypothetical protein